MERVRIANGNGHSFAALFGRGANNGSLIIQDTTNGPRTTVPWPSPNAGVWFHVTIIISSDTAEILLNNESVGILESPGIGSVNRTLFQLRNHQDLMTVSFDNFEYWEAVE